MKRLLFLFLSAHLFACGSEEAPVGICGPASVAVSLVTSTPTACGESDGALEVVAIGQGTVEYSIDGLNFQPKGTFSGLRPEQYVVTARDEAQCLGTLEVVLSSSDEISFSESIRQIIETNCAVRDCHVAAAQTPDLSIEANIFSAAPRIKRQVETGAMPFGDDRTLSVGQIDEIVCWFVNGAKKN